ncbi:hypothetical protein CTW67_004449 [Salmonella enterica subsp. enterica serovar Sandiego]|nr:hypothetical protein [Salmonella enterica subsp. enterica serovar Sandiego]
MQRKTGTGFVIISLIKMKRDNTEERRGKRAGAAALPRSRREPSFLVVHARDCTRGGNILRHSRRFFRCACKALLPAAP